MLKKYRSIRFNTLTQSPKCVTPDRGFKELTLDDPAIAVMTDHRLEQANTCLIDTSIDRALKRMTYEKNNILLATDTDDHILGLISSSDISGEKPVKYIQETGKTHDQIMVRHLMTYIEDIPSLTLQDVLDGSIGDVLFTLNEIGSGVALVTSLDQDNTVIRGILNAQAIARLLNIFFEPSPRAKSFADYTKALHGSVLTH